MTTSGSTESEELSDDQRRAVPKRLEILDALTAAIHRRREVFDLVESSPSAADAAPAIAALLGVSEIGAHSVLDLQWRCLAQLERNRILDEQIDLRARLGLGRRPGS